jgi:hypothetical protein
MRQTAGAIGSTPKFARSAQRAAGATTVLLIAWCAIGLGADIRNGKYDLAAIAAVTIGVGLLLITAWSAKRHAATAETDLRPGLAIAGVLVAVCSVWRPAGLYGSGEAEVLSRAITVVCALAFCAMAVDLLPRERRWSYCLVGFMGLAGVLMIVSSPRPDIDDWYMSQAAAGALSHLQNIYTVHWSAGVPGEATNLYAYLPGSALFVWPFHVLLGDVRYGVLAALLATSAILIRSSVTPTASLLGCLVVLYPKALFGLEQSWVDPIVTLGLCGAALAAHRGRRNWAMAALILALVCKQQAWLALPLVFVWKEFGWRRAAVSALIAAALSSLWALSDLHAFVYDVFRYQLTLPPRPDSLSIYAFFLNNGWQPPLAVLVLAVVLGYGIALRWLPRNAYGFLLGSAIVECMFNIANKQSFFNEWQLAATLLLAAVAFAPAGWRSTSPDPGGAAGRTASA